MLGGGAKVSKPMFTSYQNRGPKIHVAKKPGSVSYEDHGKITVGYSTDFDDMFGTELNSASVQVVRDVVLEVGAEGTDMFSVDTSEPSLEFRVMSVRLNPDELQSYDLSNPGVVGSILPAATLIDSIQRVHDATDKSLAHSFDKAGVFGEDPLVTYTVSSDVNDASSSNNRSRQFQNFGDVYKVHFSFNNIEFHQFVEREPGTKDVVRDSFNNPVHANIYGPFTYDVLYFAKDRNNDGNNQIDTTSVMRRQVRVDGLNDVRLDIVPSPSRPFANTSDSFVISWSFENDTGIVPLSEFNNIRLCRNNLHNTEIEHLVYSAVEHAGDSTYKVEVSNATAIDYQGEIKAHVQWKDVYWSPLNYSSTVTFAYSTQPNDDPLLLVSNSRSAYGALEETQLYIKLRPNTFYKEYFPTNLPYDVRFRFHVQDPDRDESTIRETVLFEGVTNTNVSTFDHRIASNLDPGTEYFVSYTVDDGRNPTYTGTIEGSFFTRLDDRIAPVINGFVCTPLESRVRVRASVSDETALSRIDVIALVGDIPDSDIAQMVNDASYKHTVTDFDNSNAHTLDVIISKHQDNADIRENRTYTIVIRVSDRANNTVFDKRLVETNPEIEITDVAFNSTGLHWNLQANLEFPDLPGERIDYFMGVFTSNIDASNVDLAKSLLRNPEYSANVEQVQNIDASVPVRVSATLGAAFGNLDDDPIPMNAIANYNSYNLVLYARATNTSDFGFVETLHETGLQFLADAAPPIIHRVFVDFNVGL